MAKDNEIIQKLIESFTRLDLDGTLELTKAALDSKISPYDILTKGFGKGMEEVGKLYESGTFFLSDLIASAAIMNRCMKPLVPELRQQYKAGSKGKIAVGTVFGDIHDIGKNIVAALATASGFEVIDLGIDVASEKFVEAVKQHSPDILGISALLSSTVANIGDVIQRLERSGARGKVKLVLGGRSVTEEYASKLGCYYGEDAVKGITLFEKLAKQA